MRLDDILIETWKQWSYDDQYPVTLFYNDTFSQVQIDTMHQKVSELEKFSWHSTALYIHIPFCKTQCFFCDCTVKVEDNKEKYDTYIDALELQAKRVYKNIGYKIMLETLYFWWWTPSILSIEQTHRLYSIIYTYFDCSDLQQHTFECSPYTTDEEKLIFLKYQWVNRITFWVQTFEEDILKKYNRPQEISQTLKIIYKARTLGFEYLNIDMVAWMPGQTIKGYLYTLKLIKKYISPDSIVSHAFQPTQRTLFSTSWKYLDNKDIKLRKILKRIGDSYVSQIINSKNYKYAKNAQLYDPSYAHKSLIWLGYWSMSYVFWEAKYIYNSLESYYDTFLENAIQTNHIRGYQYSSWDTQRNFIIRNLMGSIGIQKKIYVTVFWVWIEESDIYEWIEVGIKKNILALLDDGNTIKFSTDIVYLDKIRYILGYIYPQHLLWNIVCNNEKNFTLEMFYDT